MPVIIMSAKETSQVQNLWRLFVFQKEKDMIKESNPFYESPRWKHKRQQILKRDGYMCQICKRYGRIREAAEVHHIQHLEDRPDLALDNDNLISLCRTCHNRQHPEKGRDRRR